MKTNRLILIALLLSAITWSCSENDDTDAKDVAGSLADKLTAALDFENSEIIEGDPPEGVAGTGAPQIEQVNVEEELKLNQPFSLGLQLQHTAAKKIRPGLSLKYDGPDDVVATIIYVEGSGSYIKIDTALFDRDGEFWTDLFGRLLSDDELQGENFNIKIAFQTSDGTTGEYVDWRLLVQETDPADAEEIAKKLDVIGATFEPGSPPTGDSDPTLPQIVRIEGPEELAPGSSFILKLFTNHPTPEEIKFAILAIPLGEGYLRIRGEVTQTEDGYNMQVPGNLPEDMEVLDWTVTFMVALQTGDGLTGQYHDWSFVMASEISNPMPGCNDFNLCTVDSEVDGKCVNEPIVCDDNLECTQDSCDGITGACVYVLAADYCIIEEECIAAQTNNPDNGCQACLPEYAADAWSDNDGAICDDENECTQTDTCMAGECNGSNRIRCTDNGPCQGTGSCNPNSGACEYPNLDDETPCDLDDNLCTVDACTQGICENVDSVVCTATGQCRSAGTCDPATGICSEPALPDNTACDLDDSACTTDVCHAGICIYSESVICAAPGVCQQPGVCNDLTGDCEYASMQNGTACNEDTDKCTIDTCQEGECTNVSSVTCTALDQCHDVGTCVPATGLCTHPNKTDETPCDRDQSQCTVEICQTGVCTLQETITCPPTDQCHDAGICNPDNGVCSNPEKPDQTACDLDSDLCTTDICLTGSCTNVGDVTCTVLDQCHSLGSCDPGTGECDNLELIDESPCELDDDLCTTDVCMGGVCETQSTVMCYPTDQCQSNAYCDPYEGECVFESYEDYSDCDLDANLCTIDICMGGECSEGTTVECPPANDCFEEGTCDSQTGNCMDNPKPDEAVCDDMNPDTYYSACYDTECLGFQWNEKWKNYSNSNQFEYCASSNTIVNLDKGGALHVYDLEAGTQSDVQYIGSPTGHYDLIDLSLDCSTLVATVDDTYYLFDYETGELLKTKNTGSDVFGHITISADGGVFAYHYPGNNYVMILDSMMGYQRGAFTSALSYIQFMELLGNGDAILLAGGSEIHVHYDGEGWSSYPQDTFTGHNSMITDISVNPINGVLISAASNGTVFIHNFGDGMLSDQISEGFGSSSGPVAITGNMYSPSSVVWANNGLYFFGDRYLMNSFPLDHGLKPLKMWMPGDGIAVVATDMSIEVWQGGSGGMPLDGDYGPEENLISRIDLNLSSASSVAFSGDESQLVAASLNGLVKVYDSRSGYELADLSTSVGYPIEKVLWRPNGDQIAAGYSGGTIETWLNTGNWNLETNFNVPGETIGGLDYTSDGSVLGIGLYGNTIQLADPEALPPDQMTPEISATYFSDFKFSPDDSQVAIAGESGFEVWDVDTGSYLYTLSVSYYYGAVGMSWTPSGEYFACGIDFGEGSGFEVWQTSDQSSIYSSGGYSWVADTEFTDNGQHLAVLYTDQIAWYDHLTQTELSTSMIFDSDYLNDFEFSSSEELLSVGSEDGLAMYRREISQCNIATDGYACDDGNAQTYDDRCVSGVCSGTPCECQTGECCDGCRILPASIICDVQSSTYCSYEDMCFGELTREVYNQYCSGVSTDCDGVIDEEPEIAVIPCSYGSGCTFGMDTCVPGGQCY